MPKYIGLIVSLISGSAAAESLNVLLYHHVADDTPFSTSTTVADFTAQLDDFVEKGYQIVNLEQAVARIRAGKPLAQKSLALTFDDGFSSVCKNAYPELKKRGMPFTVFVTTDPIDHHYPSYCTWSQLKEMAQNGATIANHTRDHAHLVRGALSEAPWLTRAQDNISQAQQRIENKIGQTSALFAYPYGEYNNTLKQWLDVQGYIAFGQQSGSIGTTSDWQALPRFNAAGHYATPKALKLKITASPLPVDYQQLPDPLTQNTQPDLSVKVLPSKRVYYPHLQCFLNGQAIDVVWNSSQTQFSATPPKPLTQGRHRLNCTAPHRQGTPYYWLSQQWIVVPEALEGNKPTPTG
ncbi:polysaccharide deacetylase family protein [Vibrio olivae]|uniref:polysaccharide deacetylase family protein n=1 Tax=Vibrio olivae TaxID=1243002 RepID=UPI0036F24B69